jgi:NADH pyrophosphatase NudC (nudix superfamily)
LDSPPPVTDAELIADFTRMVEVDGEIRLEVAVVDWPQPHTPTMVWKTFRYWKKPPTPERLAAAQQKALTMRRFFRVCQRCGERNNAGHMHDRRICQTCAEKHLGVVY